MLQLTVLKSDMLRIQTHPSLSGLVLYQDRFGSYDSVSVATNIHHFEFSSDIRVSDLRAVNVPFTLGFEPSSEKWSYEDRLPAIAEQ
jgi:hypothetical protein